MIKFTVQAIIECKTHRINEMEVYNSVLSLDFVLIAERYLQLSSLKQKNTMAYNHMYYLLTIITRVLMVVSCILYITVD